MNTIRLAEIRADFRADLRANRLPNTAELDAWRSNVGASGAFTPLDTETFTYAHSGSAVPNDARLGGVGNEATVSGHHGACAPASLNSGGAGQPCPPAFSEQEAPNG